MSACVSAEHAALAVRLAAAPTAFDNVTPFSRFKPALDDATHPDHGLAQLLSGGVRRSDVVARIGGDEFGILLENASEESAHDTAARLVDMICGCEFVHDGEALPLSVAIGVGMIDGDDAPEAVMARADEEMYRRKAAA